MAKYIERDVVKKTLANSDLVPKYKADNRPVTDEIIDAIPTAAVAPIEALERLRDELCAQDLITMEGLKRLNALIRRYTTVHDGGTDHETD